VNPIIPAAIVIGLGATLVMDLWNVMVKWTLGIPSLNYCLLGRWLRHMPEGQFRHASIAAAAPKHFECVIGWVAHYTIGVIFGILFVTLLSKAWLLQPTLLPAVMFGVVTVVFPFFIMQPALGLGVASSRAPEPARARLKSLFTHTIFGAGLYLSAIVVLRLRG
jgi:hypothetical protein